MAASDVSLRASMDALSSFLIGDATVGDALHHVAQHSVDAVEPAAFAGVTMIVDGRLRTGVFTDPTSPQIDAAQYETGEGPCVEAFREATTIVVPSTRTDRRFTEFCRTALDHGIASTLSMPLTAGDEAFGALNLYARHEDAFDESTITTAQRFAAQAAILLANAHVHASSVTLNDQLRTAMVSRETIDLARGIIIGATRCTPDEAFDRLVAQSQHENRKLRDVADEIVNASTRHH
jgi:GAF domain-containing protein